MLILFWFNVILFSFLFVIWSQKKWRDALVKYTMLIGMLANLLFALMKMGFVVKM